MSYAEFVVDVPDSGAGLCRDIDDKPFVDLAVAREVDVLVSIDGDLLDCNGFRDFPVLSIAEFLNWLVAQ